MSERRGPASAGSAPPGGALAASLSRRGLLAGTLALLAVGCSGAQPSTAKGRAHAPTEVAADDAPAGTSIVVPWAVGGFSDGLIRLAADYWPRASAEPLLVRNVTGNSGTIGAREVQVARPDGTTLLAAHEALLTAYYLGLAPFNWQDFEPVACLFFVPEVVVTRKDRPWSDASELVADARRRPEQVTWAATFGSRSHFLPGEIMYRTGVRFKLVGYDGTASCLAALLAGEVDVANAPLAALAEAAPPGKLRPLGGTGHERAATLPDLPTLREQGLDVRFAINLGLLAPKGTPPTTLAHLEQTVQRLLAESELQQRAEDDFQAQVRYLSRTEYAERLARLDATVRVVAETMGLRASEIYP